MDGPGANLSMDKSNRALLVAAIAEQPTSENDPLPVVGLEAFFEGNDDEGSIGCNLHPHPGLEVFFSELKALRTRSDVQDVLVEIYEVENDERYWPFSERVYVLTSLDVSSVEQKVVRLEPSQVDLGWFQGAPTAALDLDKGMHVVSCWWD